MSSSFIASSTAASIIGNSAMFVIFWERNRHCHCYNSQIIFSRLKWLTVCHLLNSLLLIFPFPYRFAHLKIMPQDVPISLNSWIRNPASSEESFKSDSQIFHLTRPWNTAVTNVSGYIIYWTTFKQVIDRILKFVECHKNVKFLNQHLNLKIKFFIGFL
jgi:hypothetical protein